jgi:formylglycine-generating enzyme required for sulfatase activity
VPRKALLIGVSHYGDGLPPLSAAPNDVAALQRVLANPQMAGFDQVECLIDPELVAMQLAMRRLFSECQRDDLLLLYFSGHGITDDNHHLYLANCLTSKADFEATAVPARFIQQQSSNCYTRRQVIILDCCYSGAFKEGWQAKAAGVDLRHELGAEGRVVLTSSTATQTSFQQDETGLSLYTQYLVEGMETGAADTNQDGKIFVHELHEYAKAKVQAARPTMRPEILLDQEGFNILLSKAPLGDRTLEFRRLVEQFASQGEISIYRRETLHQQQQAWGIADDAAEAIIHSVLEPFRRRQVNLERFRAALQQEVDQQFPLPEHLEADLRDWQRQVLGLADEDVATIWQELTAAKARDFTARWQRYEQEFVNTVEAAYPLSASMRQELSQLQQSLGLRDETVSQIEAPIVAQAESRLEALRRQELERQQQQASEWQRQQEADRLRQQRAAEGQQQQAAERLRQQEAERQRQETAERLKQQKAAERARPRTQPAAPGDMRRRQVLQWAGFGGIGLLVTGIAASVRGLFGGSTGKPNDPGKPSGIVAAPKYTEPPATAAKLAGLPLWTVDFETVTVDERGENPKRAAQQAKFVKEDLGNGVTLELVAIPKGTFTMGSPAAEKDRGDDEGPQRSVNVPAFAMGRYVVTQAQYQAIMGTNPAQFKGANRPVESVSWDEAVDFCQRLSKRTGRTYDLPSEAEWEYACRAGTTTPFYFGETITTGLANYRGTDWEYQGKTHPGFYGQGSRGSYRETTTDVGIFSPNAWGLYDMHGNVWEWCLDHYRQSYQGAPTDARAWVTDDKNASRLLRGGSWLNLPALCRSASRYSNTPTFRGSPLGFRVVWRPA